MGFAILLAFIAIPLIEIAVFIEVGGYIGLWWTLAVVVGTALAGTHMLRRQGLATLRRAQENMAQGRMPLREVFDGLCLLIAGALLLTPGFVTDLAGALLLMPPVRLLLGQLVARHIVATGQFTSAGPGGQAFHGGPGAAGQRQAPGGRGPDHGAQDEFAGDDIIDADFKEVSPDEPPSRGRLGGQHDDDPEKSG
ncbi:MAG: FxsA family protein [Alphaproteobacteria bacterium]|jgi:UPF0716 protein FxsA|nr:FxsA family protein [Alphaproteobacteria bacterium]MDP6830324.1 FxsA family protein [Alphaproteobacteria bacterium]